MVPACHRIISKSRNHLKQATQEEQKNIDKFIKSPDAVNPGLTEENPLCQRATVAEVEA